MTSASSESLKDVALDILIYLDFMADSLPPGIVGRFSARQPLALRDRLRNALKETP